MLIPQKVISYYGKSGSKDVIWCNGNPFIFFLKLFTVLKNTNEHSILLFDHLGISSIAGYLPFKIKGKKIIFLHDEEAWSEVVGRKLKALQFADVLLTNSAYTYNYFTQSNPQFKNKTKVCLLGGVPDIFEQVGSADEVSGTLKKWFQKERKYVLFVSRMWKEHDYKGHWKLLEAYVTLLQEESDFPIELVLIGRGNDTDNVLNYIQRNNLNEKVHLFTETEDIELIHFYNHCEAFILPSIREGFGFVFLEAMYFGKPLIGVKRQPVEEIIENGISGMLLENNSPEEIIRILKDLAESPERYSDIGKKGKEVFEDRFTKQKFLERFRKIVNS